MLKEKKVKEILVELDVNKEELIVLLINDF